MDGLPDCQAALAASPTVTGPADGQDLVEASGAGMRPPPVQAPEAVVLATETHAVLEQVIRQLPERQRAVLVLRDVDGWPADEACALLDVSTGNQRVLLHRARAAVRSILDSCLDFHDLVAA